MNSPVAVGDLVRRTPLTEEHDLMLQTFGKRGREFKIHRDTCTRFHGIFGPSKVIVGTSANPIVEGFRPTIRVEQIGLHQRIHVPVHEMILCSLARVVD